MTKLALSEAGVTVESMQKQTTPRVTAWVPWLGGDPDWLAERDELTVAWLDREAELDGSQLVVQGTLHAEACRQGEGAMADLARRAKVATYQSPVGEGATVAPNPDVRLLATAMVRAASHAVAATESPFLALEGWAMAAGAVNLATNEVTPDQRSPEQVSLIAELVDGLYNGWSHPEVGRRATAYCLPKLAESGMSYGVFVGSLLAQIPRRLISRSDIRAMEKALPARWEAERMANTVSWRPR
jgi:hypothetical protein